MVISRHQKQVVRRCLSRAKACQCKSSQKLLRQIIAKSIPNQSRGIERRRITKAEGLSCASILNESKFRSDELCHQRARETLELPSLRKVPH